MGFSQGRPLRGFVRSRQRASCAVLAFLLSLSHKVIAVSAITQPLPIAALWHLLSAAVSVGPRGSGRAREQRPRLRLLGRCPNQLQAACAPEFCPAQRSHGKFAMLQLRLSIVANVAMKVPSQIFFDTQLHLFTRKSASLSLPTLAQTDTAGGSVLS